MAKILVLVALLLAVASLFLPLTQGLGGAVTVGILSGTMTKPEGFIFIGPAMFSALLGVLLGRNGFGRGLGALNLLFGLATVGMMSILYTEPRQGVDIGLGAHCALGAGALATLAGLVGLVKPDRK